MEVGNWFWPIVVYIAVRSPSGSSTACPGGRAQPEPADAKSGVTADASLSICLRCSVRLLRATTIQMQLPKGEKQNQKTRIERLVR